MGRPQAPWGMLYHLFQARQDLFEPMRRAARGSAELLDMGDWRHPAWHGVRAMRAALDVFGHARVTHASPAFALDPVRRGDRLEAVIEEIVAELPFASLRRFRAGGAALPKVLVVAPMSGHFATLLRNTVQVMAVDHDVHITDWRNARDVPLAAGRFGLDEFVGHIRSSLEAIGPGTHVVAVCQPVAAVLAATALMAEDRDRATPRSLTLMAGPIDARVNPTQVNMLARSKPIAWFERNLIATVPYRHRGGGRRVYPGAVQLAAFLAMNPDRHVNAHRDQLRALIDGATTLATQHRRFYDEYFAVMDLPADFYLETVRLIFQDHALPEGRLTVAGRPVRPEAIRRTAILTVEGERDDICGIGQTMAALDLCRGVPVTMKQHHLQTGVGHYGVFSGRRWAASIYPRVRAVIEAHHG